MCKTAFTQGSDIILPSIRFGGGFFSSGAGSKRGIGGIAVEGISEENKHYH